MIISTQQRINLACVATVEREEVKMRAGRILPRPIFSRCARLSSVPPPRTPATQARINLVHAPNREAI